MEIENATFVTKDQLQRIIKHFPPCIYSFAYGSAVFPQKHRTRGSMIDLVFVTEDPVEWHRLNLESNGSHYSGMRYFGPNVITELQEKFACGVYYNTYAVVDNFVIKYGVMSTKSLTRDLTDWEYLYVAGRLHKPVIQLNSSFDSVIPDLIKRNRLMALHAALLELPECTTKTELYRSITSLSYNGDCRMIFGEDPNKVENIVAPIMNEFDHIYTPLLLELFPLVELTLGGQVIQKPGLTTRLSHLQQLPMSIQDSLSRKMNTLKPSAELEGIKLLADEPSLSTILSDTISSVVLASSIRQTLVGFVSTGIIGSIRYALDKVMKKTVALSKYYRTTTSRAIDTKQGTTDCELTEFVFNWSDSNNSSTSTEDKMNWNDCNRNKTSCSFMKDLNGASVNS